MRLLFASFLILLLTIFSLSQYTIQQYLSIRSASGPSISPDGTKIAYLTNVSGTSQVWIVDVANGKPRQLTFYDDNVSFVSFSPRGDGLVFGKARGGDENTQLFWISLDGSSVKQLTNDPKVRHNFGGWLKDGTKIYYASNKRNRNYFDIYSMDLTTGKEDLIYQQDGSNSFAAISDDGNLLVVSRPSTELSLDNNLYLIDLKTKRETLLTPHKDASLFGDVTLLKDSIVFTSNKDREFAAIMQINLNNLREVKVLNSNDKWDVEALVFPENGKYFAYTINTDGFTELWLRAFKSDAKTTKILAERRQVKLPARGVASGFQFSKNGKLLVFSFNSSRYNSDIWLYDVERDQLKQITESDLAGIERSSFVEPELIKYKTFDGLQIPAWYYKPKESGKKLAVIVSVHGGPEAQERPVFNAIYQYFLSRGYAILAPNVRGSTGYGKTYTHLDDIYKREDSVKDLAAAVEWLKTFGNADEKKIAVMGGSYGGYMTMAAITLYPDLWAAAVNTVGIVNWETFLKNTSEYRRRQREVEYGFLERDLEFLRSISPIYKVDRIKTPLFVIHGKNDPRVPYTEAEQIVEALKKRGKLVEYRLFDDEGHGISKLKNRLELYPAVAKFLEKYLQAN